MADRCTDLEQTIAVHFANSAHESVGQRILQAERTANRVNRIPYLDRVRTAQLHERQLHRGNLEERYILPLVYGNHFDEVVCVAVR